MPPSSPSPFPQFFLVIPKGNPSVVDIKAHLLLEIGIIPPVSDTRMRDSFCIKTDRDSQSLMLSLMDFSKSDTIQKVFPRPGINQKQCAIADNSL